MSRALAPKLAAKLADIRARRAFNAEAWVNAKVAVLNKYMTDAGLKACVVNVSGGVDSAVTLLLVQKAAQAPGSPIQKVLGLLQPIHSTPGIQNRGFDQCKAAGIDYFWLDQTEFFDALASRIEEAAGIKDEKGFAKGQLRSYMRTPPIYYTAQLLSSAGFPAVVVGTGNFDEDGYLFYFCKAGDGTTDIQLIHDLHKSEVFKVGAYLGVLESILNAPPSADLWDGQTDEDELGFSYDFVELYTELTADYQRDGWVAGLDGADLEQWTKWSATVEQIHKRNKHKKFWPVNLDICVPVIAE